jgi:DNA-binding response OmpR family regulator
MERILVVDDEKEVCRALEEFLILKGYEVTTAFDGPSALAAIRNKKPNVVLLDIIMPGMSGIEVLREIKTNHPGIGVIMITAVTDEAQGNATLAMGADDYITKPVDLDYLELVLMVKIIDILG